MRRFTTHDPTAYGGCTLTSDSVRWADTDWRANLGKSDPFDAPPEEPATPPPAGARPSVRIAPWPPRTSEGLARYPQPVIRAGRFRTLGEVFTLVLVCAGVGYVCSGWELGGWLALAVLLLMLVGWVLERVYRRRMGKQFRDLLTDRWDYDLSSAPVTRPRTRPTHA